MSKWVNAIIKCKNIYPYIYHTERISFEWNNSWGIKSNMLCWIIETNFTVRVIKINTKFLGWNDSFYKFLVISYGFQYLLLSNSILPLRASLLASLEVIGFFWSNIASNPLTVENRTGNIKRIPFLRTVTKALENWTELKLKLKNF